MFHLDGNCPHRSIGPHPLDVTDAPDDVTPQRHCAAGWPRSGLVPRDVSRRGDVGGERKSHPSSSYDRRGISRGQLITEAAAGLDSLIIAAYIDGTRRECSNINECTCPGVSGD